jgi:hypothetical protein
MTAANGNNQLFMQQNLHLPLGLSFNTNRTSSELFVPQWESCTVADIKIAGMERGNADV